MKFNFLPKKTWQWILLAVIGIPLLYFFSGWPTKDPNTAYGITWSKPYAEELGLNSDVGLSATMQDLGVKRVRLPAYWALIEPQKGSYDFPWLDSQFNIVEQQGGSITLAIGSRLPRWPECWEPDWVKNLSPSDREAAQLAYIQAVYKRYAGRSSIMAWQVENEMSFTFFADCQGLTKDLVTKELDYVRGQEQMLGANKRPVMTTDSGELSTWLSLAGHVDGKGVSIYRIVTNPFLGVIRYWFVPPWTYARKALLASPFVGPIHISEFQMEPWSNAPLERLSNSDLFVTFDAKQMEKNLKYAEQLHMPEVYFWGAEWWYWMKETRQHPEFWDQMQQFFVSHKT